MVVRSANNREATQTLIVSSYFTFIISGQNHLARHSERGKKTRRIKTSGESTTSENGQGCDSASSQRAVKNNVPTAILALRMVT